MSEHKQSEQLKKAQEAVTDYLAQKYDSKEAGVSQAKPACTLRTACSVCGSVAGKAWAPKAKELCRHGCYWILAGHIAFNGLRQKLKFFSADAVSLMKRYKTYNQLVIEGARLDARKAVQVEVDSTEKVAQ